MTQGTSFNYMPEGVNKSRFLSFAERIGFFGVASDDKLSKWRAYWLLAPHALFSLIVGFVIVIVSLIFQIKPAASGAVLVGASVIAEFFHNRWLYRQLIDVDLKNFMFPAACKSFHLNPRALRDLAKPDDFYPNERDDEVAAGYDSNWLYNRTVRRVDENLVIVIVIAIVIGTILWGYGDLLVPCKYLCA